MERIIPRPLRSVSFVAGFDEKALSVAFGLVADAIMIDMEEPQTSMRVVK